MLPPRSTRRTPNRLMLPNPRTLSLNPSPTSRIPLEIAILVPIPPLEERQEGVPERRIHPHGLAGEVGPDLVSGEGLFEERFLECAPAVECPRGSHAWGIRSSFTSGVVPCAEGVSSSVQRAESLDARLGAFVP